MKNLFNNWKKFLTEEKLPQQDYHEILVKIAISKNIGPNKTESLRYVRAIPEVTTVFEEETISENDNVTVDLYKVKVVLKPGENIRKFVYQTLVPEASEIPGLSVDKDSITFEKLS